MKMSMRTSNLRVMSQKWKVGHFSLVEDFHCSKDSSSYTGPGLWKKLFSHLIGRETINIPEIFSGVRGFTGKTVNNYLPKIKKKPSILFNINRKLAS